MLPVVLYLIAVVLLTLAAFGVGVRQVSLGWLGLALAVFTATLLPALV